MKKNNIIKSPHPAFSHLLRPEKVKLAFTLAEVLITIGIIGVVAALTIPTLVQNIEQRGTDTAADVFIKKFEQSLKVMNSQGVLGGYSTTERFVEELQKHTKIINVCDNNNLSDCFEKTIFAKTYLDKKITIDTTPFTTSAEFAVDDWGTNVVGLQFINGVNALLAYNPQCDTDPYNTGINVMDCVAMMYDVTGSETPNLISQDIRLTANTKTFSYVDIAGIKVAKIIKPSDVKPLTMSECNAEKNKLALQSCSVATDYYAGAVKMCGGLDKLPTSSQLLQIANELKDPSTGTFSESRAASYGFRYLTGWAFSSSGEHPQYVSSVAISRAQIVDSWRSSADIVVCLY